MRYTVKVAESPRRQSQVRESRRQKFLTTRLLNEPERFCLACKTAFNPKQRDSWFCSRRCIDRVSWHRKQARAAEAAAIARDYRRSSFGISNPLTLADLRRRWRDSPQRNEANYRLWFPDLCALSPEEALAVRQLFQVACREKHE
jgi:predicted nucleic acid-binding Zn ribbon protein